jgi:hypothetical protein
MECRLWLRFLLARLQLSYVLNKNGQPNMKRVLKNLPATPDDAYRETMNRIENAGEYTPRTAFRTLAWILHAARPLRMDELREALAVHEAWFENEEIGFYRTQPYLEWEFLIWLKLHNALCRVWMSQPYSERKTG